MKKWNKEEEKWLMDNYPFKGIRYCMNYLNVSYNQLVGKRDRLKLKLDRKFYSESRLLYKTDDEYTVNPMQFINVKTKEAAYLLGIIWADGTIYYKNEIGNRKSAISLTLLNEDFIEIQPILEKTGKWSYYKYIPKYDKNKCFSSAKINNKKLINFLIENDYHIKSGASAIKIINKIPIDLRRYFFQGLIDGDGCYYYNEKNKLRKFNITSTYDQEWDYLTLLLNDLDISFKITKRITSKGKYSRIEFGGFNNILKIKNYLFPIGFELGFKRKFNKLLQCINSYTRKSSKL